MADDTWPASLPQNPIGSGFSETRKPNVVRTQMDVGPPKVRRRHTAAIEIVEYTFRMTDAQLDTFKTFFETTLKDGTKKFDFTHPQTEALGEYRFVEPPSWKYAFHDVYDVSVHWEKLP